MENKFDQIRRNPSPSLSWPTPTDTFFYWSSALDYRSADYLKLIRFPIAIAHGSDDEELAVEPTQELVQELLDSGHKNVHYEERDGLDHFWNDKDGNNYYQQVLESIISLITH